MDIDLNSNGNSNQVGNLTVLIGSDPFLPQPDSPREEPELITADENLNTPPLPSPSVTPEYQTKDLTKPLHLYLEADICLDTESKQILETPSSSLDKDPPLSDLGPIDPDIFASPPQRKRKRKASPPTIVSPPEQPTENILYRRIPTPILIFVPPLPQRSNTPVRPLLLVQPVHIPAGKSLANPPSLLQIIEGRKPTFTTHLLERTHSLFSIFHPDYLIRERHSTLQERRYSLQNDSLDCLSYIVDLHFRSLVKLRQESQIPPPNWRGPPRK